MSNQGSPKSKTFEELEAEWRAKHERKAENLTPAEWHAKYGSGPFDENAASRRAAILKERAEERLKALGTSGHSIGTVRGAKMELDWRELGKQVGSETAMKLVPWIKDEMQFNQSLPSVLQHPELWLSSPVTACATDFIESEMDCETEGKRGYGRFAESIPRLAAWQRKGFSRLDYNAADVIRRKIAESLLTGYCIALLVELPICKQIYQPQDVTKEQLWRAWIPSLYGSPRSADALKAFRRFFEPFAELDAKKFEVALSRVGIRIGMLARVRFLAIVKGYIENGNLLRQLEVWGKF